MSLVKCLFRSFAYFIKKFYFNWRLFTLQCCGGFCHTFTQISHGCTCIPHPEPPSHLPPYPIPQGHPSAAALSTLSHASNLDWRNISHMKIYMFQCYPPPFLFAFDHQKINIILCLLIIHSMQDWPDVLNRPSQTETSTSSQTETSTSSKSRWRKLNGAYDS